ncbi:MAG: CDP-glycerol glycerophosphotransferase family protein [Leucobacter sp.]|nr:CDP-glycerol glycerophosphotransferase family protein [Leucobacter sp.]
MTKTRGFSFARGNLAKLWAAPAYALGALLSWFVPRVDARWVFGSGIGVGEGALALARELRRSDPAAVILWAVPGRSLDASPEAEADAERARRAGFAPVPRDSWAGFWATLRARMLVVTHGLGDVNRFGQRGARIIHLGHGSPLKRLHFDAPVTTSVSGPAPLRALLRRMYAAGSRSVELYVAGSLEAAGRLRTAYRVAPGKVRVLGDPRDDELAAAARDAGMADRSRAELRALIGLEPGVEPLVLYAPTWRDGEPDPAAPTPEEAAEIQAALQRLGARLVIRSHRLGAGAYEIAQPSVHLLGSDVLRDITPLLAGFDAVITDYSSLALDFALTGGPIVWFAPDLERYTLTRGLYEPLEVTAAGRVQRTWSETLERLREVLATGDPRRAAAQAESRALAARFHAHPEGGAAARVLGEIRRLGLPDAERVAPGGVFFESFYGRQAACNPLALDREIAGRAPELPRYWSVASESVAVPEGAIPVLVGGADWFAARRQARLLIVNDWLRFGFRRGRGQTVLQTWHGTMLKHLALGRPRVRPRTRLAILRERRRWSLMLSQNPHSTAQFRSSYAFRGEVLELGYPRDDRLARSVAAPGVTRDRADAADAADAAGAAAGAGTASRIPLAVETARRVLGVPRGAHVLAYAPTWREGAAPGVGAGVVDALEVRALAAELNTGTDAWVVVARGHTRTHEFGGYGGDPRVIDASAHPDVNDVILAADLLVTDYSSVMFDAAVARVPLAFFVPDLADYRDRERGFTFDFEACAPGPLLASREQVIEAAKEAIRANGAVPAACVEAYRAWRARFAPHDDGYAAARVVDALVERGALPPA